MTPRQRRADIAAAAGSLVATLALLVGVPILLAVLAGWPLPRSLPDPTQIRQALDNGWSPDGTFVLKAIAVVAWVAWLQIAACLVVELVAAVRGRRRAPHVWLAGWAQPLASRLVAGLLLLQTLGAATPASALPALAVGHLAMSPAALDTPPPAQPTQTAPAPSRPLPVYLIHRHDTLWDIAERHLGDPLRWREIFDLNHDRAQPDGRHLTDPDRIYPGWTLTLPVDATDIDVSAATAPAPWAAPSAPTPTAKPPPSANGTADCPTPTTIVPTTTAPTKADSTKAPISTPSRPPAATSSAAPPAGATNSMPGPDNGRTVRSRAGRHHGIPINDIGLPLLATGGVVAAVDRARRMRQRRRLAGQRPARPPASAEPIERKARAIAADQAAEWVDTTLRYLASQLTRRSEQVPNIVGVRVGELGMEILIEPGSEHAPEGFESVDDGHVWWLSAHLELAAMQLTSDGTAAPCPALITLGHSPDGPVLLNLEHAGTLLVDGDPDKCTAFLAGAALEIATAPWADTNRVILTGPDADELMGLDQVERALDVTALAEELQRTATTTQAELGQRHSTLAARVEATWSDSWEATVVVAPAKAANPEALERVWRAASPNRSGLTLLTSARVGEPEWRLTIDGDGIALLHPLGLVLRSTIDADAVAGAAALIAAATQEAATPLDGPEVRAFTEEPSGVELDGPPRRDEDGLDDPTASSIEARVLGPVEIEGWARPTNRRKVIEIVAYLATHQHRPVPSDTLRCALWPLDDDGHDIAYATFKQAVSRARAALGDDSAGAKHLPDAHDGAYRLGPGVTSDWTRFQRLAQSARAAASGDAIDLLREALSLVRGSPFADVAPGTFSWAWSEQIVSDIEVAVTDAAEHLAQLALDCADPATAAWAARQGLLVVPAHEGLQRDRMRAADVAGDADGLEQAFREAERAAAGADPLDGLSEETVALYRQLSAARNGHEGNGNGGAPSEARHATDTPS